MLRSIFHFLVETKSPNQGSSEEIRILISSEVNSNVDCTYGTPHNVIPFFLAALHIFKHIKCNRRPLEKLFVSIHSFLVFLEQRQTRSDVMFFSLQLKHRNCILLSAVLYFFLLFSSLFAQRLETLRTFDHSDV